MLKDIFPPIETSLELEPEELALSVLRHLDTGIRRDRYQYTSESNQDNIDYAGEQKGEFCKRLMEAWIWLEKEMFLAPRPGSVGTDAFFITRKGRKVLEEQNFESYKKGNLLPSVGLDPILVRKVKPLFIRGDYDTAVFQAFREVEIRVRQKAGYGNDKVGASLMRDAFNPVKKGPLVDGGLEPAEQQGISDLFAGAMGIFRNPAGHRDVEYADPDEVADIIHIANQLLRMCERCGV